MSTTDTLQTIGIILTALFSIATLILAIRTDRAQRRAEARQHLADEWEDEVASYAAHIVAGLEEHTHSGDMYPEYPVPPAERKLAHAAVQRGLLGRGTVSGHVTLPGRESTPTVDAVGLYGGIFRS